MQESVKGADAIGVVWSRMSAPITLIAIIVLPILITVLEVVEISGRSHAVAIAFGILLSSIFVAHVGHRQPDLSSRAGDVLVHLFGIGLGGILVGIPVMILGMIGGFLLEGSMSEAEARMIATVVAGVVCVVAYLIFIRAYGVEPSRGAP